MTNTEKNSDDGGVSRSRTFETSLQELEASVRRLEEGNLTLDEATRLFEEGMRLASRCNELLSAAELKVSRLKSGFSDQMSLVPEDLQADRGDGSAD